MGSRGAFIGNKLATRSWKTIGKINNMKIVQKLKAPDNKLPEYSNTPSARYIRLTSDGTFRQLRTYNAAKQPMLDIEYGYHDGVPSLHVHLLNGDPSHKNKETIFIKPGDPLYQKYQAAFKGVKHEL